MNGKPTLAQLRSMIGNPNAYAVQHTDGSYHVEKKPLSNAVLLSHLKGEQTVGTYIVKPPDQARTLVFDIDSGEKAHLEALKIAGALDRLGIPKRSVGIEHSGGKGYHVWVVLSKYTDAGSLRHLGLTAAASAEVRCEVFPKQGTVKELGNLVKLPGGVHRVTGKANNFLVSFPVPQPVSTSVVESVMNRLPKPEVKRTSTSAQPLECMAKIQEGVEEGGRNHALFHLATMLRRGGVAEEFVPQIVRTAAERCSPPMDDAEVSALLDSSLRSGPICGTLPDSLQCESCPVRAAKGLYAKPGQLVHGAAGELAVVEVGKRDGDGVIELIHPDISIGKVRLR